MAHDGGPAFPFTSHDSRQVVDEAYPGMSMRDYFAAAALTLAGETAKALPSGSLRGASTAAFIATTAYAIADAMLKARGE